MRVIAALTILLTLSASLFTVALEIPFGEPAATAMDQYYLEYGQEETGANNMVTAILFDYRGIDTLGEASVLFTAVLGVGLVFRTLMKGEEYEND